MWPKRIWIMYKWKFFSSCMWHRSFLVLIRRLAGMRWTFQLRNIFVVWNPVGLFALFVWPKRPSERERGKNIYSFVHRDNVASSSHRIISIFLIRLYVSLDCIPNIWDIFPYVCVRVSVCARHLRFCVIIKVKLQTEKFVHAQRPYATNMRTMDRLVETNKKRRKKNKRQQTHTRTKWNIFISFQQEILKHKIESEFSSAHSCNFTKLLLWHDEHPHTHTMVQTETIEKIRNSNSTHTNKKSHRIESKNIFRQSNNCSECWWCQKRGCG